MRVSPASRVPSGIDGSRMTLMISAINRVRSLSSFNPQALGLDQLRVVAAYARRVASQRLALTMTRADHSLLAAYVEF